MKTIRILLADDHVVVRQGTRQLLEREQDFEIVGEAGDGEEVVQLALKLKPDVTVIKVDKSIMIEQKAIFPSGGNSEGVEISKTIKVRKTTN